MRKYDTVLFDLDGTLLDSLEDMKDSVNHVMEEFGFPKHSLEEIRSFVGNGIRRLIERSVPEGTDGETCERALQSYRSYYNDHCMIRTRPYDGIPELFACAESGRLCACHRFQQKRRGGGGDARALLRRCDSAGIRPE